MESIRLKKIWFIISQHVLSAVAMLLVAVIMFNSYVTVKSLNGTVTYTLDAFGTEKTFEDSALFRDLFQNAVADVTRLVVIKGQLETDGVLDTTKHIDVTQFANRREVVRECNITAVYELDDLIKWGKYGIKFIDTSLPIQEFVEYFGEYRYWDNFAYDQYGQLNFVGYNVTDEKQGRAINISGGTDSFADSSSDSDSGQTDSNVNIEINIDTGIDETYMESPEGDFTNDELADMAFSYIIGKIPNDISVSKDSDGVRRVHFKMLVGRYETVDGERQIVNLANNWIDYFNLVNNIVDTVDALANNYEQYQECKELYEAGAGNFKYAVQITTEDGLQTYTNIPELENADETMITEYFGEYRRYFIYYPDSLEFTGNTSLSEDDIFAYLNEYSYAYPDSTHIWIGVDTTYPVKDDSFYNAYKGFERIVPRINLYVSIIFLLILLWIAITVYLTMIIGDENEDGQRIVKLKPIDKMWSEIECIFAFGVVYAFVRFYPILQSIAMDTFGIGNIMERLLDSTFYRFAVFAIYGALISVFADLFWFSLVRRMKIGNIWSDSMLRFAFIKTRKAADFVINHGNTAFSILLAYNLFLFFNLGGIFILTLYHKNHLFAFIDMVILILFDVVVGMILFKNAAEKTDIVEGIKRIRDGEVDYKLNADLLHGTNKEMADAVNNIGEGIRKAVKTSMKDERMKTDLITNVSHDLKTPLTSIISYVDLIKREKIDNTNVNKYVDILDQKTQRLKQLTDDLVEVSKISSGNIVLEKNDINMTELINQAIGEFSEKFDERRLEMIFSSKAPELIINVDARRMWRVIENLFNNIYKYAMEGTRVYVDQEKVEEYEMISIKNISASAMNIKPEELTERFIRGDSSRTTEGSGLGLSIAKSLTEAMGGDFEIQLDGDLFKIVLKFPVTG